MPEFTSIDTRQVTLTGSVQSLDASKYGGSSITIKNMQAAGGNLVYVGPAVNRAGDALSATTGFPLGGGESYSCDFTLTSGSEILNTENLSVIGTANDKVAVIVLGA